MDIATILRERWALDHFGARTEELLRNSLFVLAANGLTLLELSPLLTHTGFRAACMKRVTNAEVKQYFELRFDPLSDAMRAVMREPILNKTSAFTGDPTPTGSVTLVGGTLSGNGNLVNGSTTISIPAGAFGVGTDQLTATYTPDSASSSAYNGATGVGSVIVTQANPVPVISSLSPAFSSAGGTAFTLTVNGLGFAANSTVYWGTTALVTQYGSATQLTAQVPASDIVNTGTTTITVQTPAPGGGTSNSLQFEVDSAGSGTPPPTFTTVTATVTPGSTATYPVTLPSSATSVLVSCLNLPSGATCSYSSTTNVVTISTSSTTPAGTYQITVVFTETLPGAASAFVLLPILLLPLLFLRRKLAVRGIWFTVCLGLVLMTAAAFITGCGGGSSGGGGGGTPRYGPGASLTD